LSTLERQIPTGGNRATVWSVSPSPPPHRDHPLERHPSPKFLGIFRVRKVELHPRATLRKAMISRPFVFRLALNLRLASAPSCGRSRACRAC
jgi:hypothetical protein